MAEIKTKPTKASVAKYLVGIGDPLRRKDCKIIDKLMREATGQKPVMWGASLVGYGKQIMHYSTGRKVEWLVVGFSSRKDAISLYLTCDLDEFGSELKKLGKYRRGVGCLYVKKLEDIDMKVLEKLALLTIQKTNIINK